MSKEISSWAHLEDEGLNIEILKKKIRCNKCQENLENYKEFFRYRGNIFQEKVHVNTPTKEERLTEKNQFSHYHCFEND